MFGLSKHHQCLHRIRALELLNGYTPTVSHAELIRIARETGTYYPAEQRVADQWLIDRYRMLYDDDARSFAA